MFGNILGKSDEEVGSDTQHSKIVEKVSKMNLTEMKTYVNNKITDFEICEDGLSEVMRRLISKDANGHRFIETDAMDSKKSKAFELVILIASSKKVTIVSSELIQEFMETYKDLIAQVDKENMQIYASRLKDALVKSIVTLEQMTAINKKLGVLGK